MLTDEQMARRRQAYRAFKDGVPDAAEQLAVMWGGLKPLTLEGQEWKPRYLPGCAHIEVVDDGEHCVFLGASDARDIAAWLLSLIGERIETRPEEGADGQ